MIVEKNAAGAEKIMNLKGLAIGNPLTVSTLTDDRGASDYEIIPKKAAFRSGGYVAQKILFCFFSSPPIRIQLRMWLVCLTPFGATSSCLRRYMRTGRVLVLVQGIMISLDQM